MSNCDYIGYGHIADAIEDNANPVVTSLPWEVKHKMIKEIIEVVNSYAKAATKLENEV